MRQETHCFLSINLTIFSCLILLSTLCYCIGTLSMRLPTGAPPLSLASTRFIRPAPHSLVLAALVPFAGHHANATARVLARDIGSALEKIKLNIHICHSRACGNPGFSNLDPGSVAGMTIAAYELLHDILK